MKRPATLAEMQAHYGERYRWLLLLAVMVGTMAAIMSSTIINVAIPDLSHHFAVGQERAHWVSSGFMVASTVSMLTTPWLLDSFGYRKTYVLSTLMLLAGGVGGGLANHFGLVLAARVVEGLAAGIVQPIPAIIIIRAFQPHERGRAGGIFGMGVVLAPALGPSIGGLLVEWFGWRSIFFMVAPFCLTSLWLAYRYVPANSPGGVAPDRRNSKLDWQGLLLCTVGTLCLLNGLVELHSSAHAPAFLLLGVALLCVLGFVWWQQRQARHSGSPLMHMDLFKHRPFAMGSLVAFIYGTALFGSTYLLPLYIQMGQGLSAAMVGTIMLPAGLVLAFTIPLAGRLSDRVPIHLMISLGILLLAASFALMATIGLHATLWALVTWTILGRIGLGFILPSLNNGAMQGMEHRLISQASSAINFLRMLGGAAGISLCGIILQWRMAAHGAQDTAAAPSAARLAAFDETFVLLALVCALAVLAAWRLRQPPKDDKE